MVRLFYGLCKEAGLIAEVPAIENAPKRATGDRPVQQRRASSKRAAHTASPPDPKPVTPAPTPPARSLAPDFSHLHPALIGLLKAVPVADEPWPSRERFASFKAAWDATLAVSNPVPPGDGDDAG
jgi:hypothetical protein